MFQSVRWADPRIYGIDWDATDDPPKEKKREGPIIRSKPFCTIDGCTNRVATEHNKPKPWCTEHIFESPYVQDVLRRYANIDDREDRKLANERLKAEAEKQGVTL